CFLLLLVLPYNVAQAGVFERTLPNGLKVIVKEDHRAPVVVQQIWYKVGSIDEFNGTTGVSHALEHMMFKGTKKVPAGQFSKLIAEAGGRENAFTAQDYTAFFQELDKSRLPLAMKLESDRMKNLLLSEKEFSKEIRVVMEERRLRTADQPHALLYEKMMSVAYQESPYRRPVIGWMNDLESLTVQDVRNWYRRWYAPNNATLVVVGDVDHEKVFQLARKYYGRTRPSSLPERKPQIEPEQEGMKLVHVEAPANLPYMMMGYHVPVIRDAEKDWEPYALDVLAGVLDGYDAARLDRALTRESQIAVSVGAEYEDVGRGAGMFVIDATPAQGKKVTAVEEAIKAQIEKIAKEGVTKEELERVKALVTASHVFQRDSMFYQAMQIGQLESVGLSYRDVDVMLKKINEVTADQVKEVAGKYFADRNLTLAVLDPVKGGEHGK
ncbi:MAG TPA: pitrilysin family protein, partial [Burkholderiales bacterium]|nr:pitrilysin family protein [Burkholderiales bacterium]